MLKDEMGRGCHLYTLRLGIENSCAQLQRAEELSLPSLNSAEVEEEVHLHLGESVPELRA